MKRSALTAWADSAGSGRIPVSSGLAGRIFDAEDLAEGLLGCYHQLNRRAEVDDIVTTLECRYPDDPDALAVIAAQTMRDSNLPASRAILERAVVLAHGSGLERLTLQLAEVCARQKDFASAARLYRETFGDNPSDPHFPGFVVALYNAGLHGEALERAQAARGSGPVRPVISEIEAIICEAVGDLEADYLWQDQRATYEHLKNPNGHPIDVSHGKFANRLSAYLHQKGLTGTEGKYLRSEVERVGEAIRSLIAYQAEAHKPVTREAARSVAIATCVLLGEFALRTDMAPIECYGKPATSPESA